MPIWIDQNQVTKYSTYAADKNVDEDIASIVNALKVFRKDMKDQMILETTRNEKYEKGSFAEIAQAAINRINLFKTSVEWMLIEGQKNEQSKGLKGLFNFNVFSKTSKEFEFLKNLKETLPITSNKYGHFVDASGFYSALSDAKELLFDQDDKDHLFSIPLDVSLKIMGLPKLPHVMWGDYNDVLKKQDELWRREKEYASYFENLEVNDNAFDHKDIVTVIPLNAEQVKNSENAQPSKQSRGFLSRLNILSF